MQRIIVTGSTGAGKSTLAREIARRLGVPHVELDALYWDPGWTSAPPDVFRARVDAALPADGHWVVDGNFSSVRDLIWGRADTLVWLDYPFPLVFWRLFLRCIRRGVRREELFNGNREELWKHFFTRESLFLWLLQSHWRRRRESREALTQPAYAHLTVRRFRRPKQAQAWLMCVRESATT
jgi:adenylate kinase family enzyme